MSSLLKGRTFKAEIIRAGTVKYDNETILIREENLDKIVKAFEGVPAIIGHESIDESNIDTLKVGRSGKSGMGVNGFRNIDMIIDDDRGIQAINNGAKVSWSGKPIKTLEGGTYNNVPYDREIVEVEGLHIGLVDDPRYEEAAIYENSKSSKNDDKDDNQIIKSAMFNLFNNSKNNKEMDLENLNIMVGEESFKASDLLENSKEGLRLKTEILENEKDKEEEKKEEPKENEKEEEKEEPKDNEKEEKKEDEESEKPKDNEKKDDEDMYELSNGDKKSMKSIIEMANKYMDMKAKDNEKEEDEEKKKDKTMNNSKTPIKDAIVKADSSPHKEGKASNYVSLDKGLELGKELF
jgi:hypothetical protein